MRLITQLYLVMAMLVTLLAPVYAETPAPPPQNAAASVLKPDGSASVPQSPPPKEKTPEAASNVDSQKECQPNSCRPNDFFLYFIPTVVLIGSFMAILAVRGALKSTSWSLADALSEEVDLPVFKEITDTQGVKTREPVYGKDEKPVLVPEMRASSSRVVALMGMIAILFLFIGFGVFILFSFGNTGKVPPSSDQVVHFLFGGLTLFAPYVVNKFASVFQGLSGSK
ncbi:hypothetical protein [Undibacterium sp. TS12]|uniref:hypothetical protein n=1 Tax=Undibacterium sp. TS12 TaxID=2908202 RepID=UPI001F4D21CF|nr:hypothetical protein [Undibacterium sp. TS12]MCH8618048.1 hypothetical protein [Undibacterium sp. TS12]